MREYLAGISDGVEVKEPEDEVAEGNEARVAKLKVGENNGCMQGIGKFSLIMRKNMERG